MVFSGHLGWKNSNENNSAHSEKSTLKECSQSELDTHGHLGKIGETNKKKILQTRNVRLKQDK